MTITLNSSNGACGSNAGSIFSTMASNILSFPPRLANDNYRGLPPRPPVQAYPVIRAELRRIAEGR